MKSPADKMAARGLQNDTIAASAAFWLPKLAITNPSIVLDPAGRQDHRHRAGVCPVDLDVNDGVIPLPGQLALGDAPG